jgi:hypothetical protein
LEIASLGNGELVAFYFDMLEEIDGGDATFLANELDALELFRLAALYS